MNPKYMTFGVEPPIQNFIGRRTDLEKLHNKIYKEAHRFLALVGPPGVGKTQIARMYAKTYSSDYDHILWFNAENMASLRHSYECLAQCLGLDDKLLFETKVHKVHRYFHKEKTLCIYDGLNTNCDDLNSCIFNNCNTFLLVTTQLTFLRSDLKKQFVKMFTETIALQFLKKNLKTDYSEKDLKTIIKKLGYHPLALQQAVSYMNETHVTSACYTEYMKINLQKLLLIGVPSEKGAQSIIKLINFVLQKLKLDNEKLALELLCVMSYMNGKAIKRYMLRSIAKSLNEEYDDLDVNEGIKLLEKYSLVNLENIDSKFCNEHFINVHKLTQEGCMYFQKQEKVDDFYFKKYLSYLKTNLEYRHFEHYEHLVCLFHSNTDVEIIAKELIDHLIDIRHILIINTL